MLSLLTFDLFPEDSGVLSVAFLKLLLRVFTTPSTSFTAVGVFAMSSSEPVGSISVRQVRRPLRLFMELLSFSLTLNPLRREEVPVWFGAALSTLRASRSRFCCGVNKVKEVPTVTGD